MRCVEPLSESTRVDVSRRAWHSGQKRRHDQVMQKNVAVNLGFELTRKLRDWEGGGNVESTGKTNRLGFDPGAPR